MIWIRLSAACVAIAACSLLTACKPKPANVPEATVAPAVVDGTPATEAECKEFAASLSKAIASKDAAAFRRTMSIEDAAIRCLGDLNLSEKDRRDIVQGMREGLEHGGVASPVFAELEKGGTYKLLRIYEVEGRFRLRYRFLSSDSTANYHDLLITRKTSGELKVEDIYIFSTGEMLTKTLRRLLLPVAAELNRKAAGSLRADDRVYLKNLKKIDAMAEAARSGNRTEAIRAYKALPKELREQKTFLHMYMVVSNGDDEEYVSALELYRRLFPDDPAIDFNSIDYFLLKKQYHDALRSIDKTEKWLGGDPYMNVLRANVFVEAAKFKEAKAAAEKAIEEDSMLTDAYWSRISVALKEKNHVDAFVWLKKIVETRDVEIGDLKDSPDYADFVKSTQHAEWVKWYAARMK